jgi:hypothetical protein
MNLLFQEIHCSTLFSYAKADSLHKDQVHLTDALFGFLAYCISDLEFILQLNTVLRIATSRNAGSIASWMKRSSIRQRQIYIIS